MLFNFAECISFIDIALTPKGPRGPKWVAAKTGHVITNCDLF
jgi:hypothetical protein